MVPSDQAPLGERLDAAVEVLRSRVGSIPPVAVVLGSGLGDFTSRLGDPIAVPYAELPCWPAAAVLGHRGHVVAGTLAGTRVVALAGRAHLYEGHGPAAAVFPVRVLARAGVKTVILTNAAGGLDPRHPAGTLMVIDDHLNLTGANPLVGPNDDSIGPRFPDMTEVYSRRLRRIADEAATAIGVSVAHGVYAGVLGPSYETPAEIRAFASLGATAVGMSTVLEAIALRHMGVDVLGLSCIANAAAGLGADPLSQEDVVAVAARVQGIFGRLLEEIVARL